MSDLNLSPKKYVVSMRVKQIFFVCFIFGLLGYFGLIIQRRVLQNKYFLENYLAGVKLAPTLMPNIIAQDPVSSKLVKIANNNQWLLVNLWATWCPPCKEEMPSLEMLHKKLGHKLKIIALSVDDNKDSVLEFIKSNKPGFTVLWDHEQIAPGLFGVNKYPETFLISPDGVLTTQFSGPRDWASPTALEYLAGFF